MSRWLAVNLVRKNRAAPQEVKAAAPEPDTLRWTAEEALLALKEPDKVRRMSLATRRALQAVVRPAVMERMPVQDQSLEVVKSRWLDAPEGPMMQGKPNHFTLVDVKRLLQLGNLPRRAWEPLTYLYTEACTFGFQRVLDQLENLLVTSQSVDGYRSVQTVDAMHGDRPMHDRPSSYLAPGIAGKEGTPRGLRPN